MSEKLRPIDGNGHVPDDQFTAEFANCSPDYQLGYQAAMLDMIHAGLAECRRILGEALEKTRRPA